MKHQEKQKLVVRVDGLHVTGKKNPGLLQLLVNVGFGRGMFSEFFKPLSHKPTERTVTFYSTTDLHNALEELTQHGVSVRPARRPRQK